MVQSFLRNSSVLEKCKMFTNFRSKWNTLTTPIDKKCSNVFWICICREMSLEFLNCKKNDEYILANMYSLTWKLFTKYCQRANSLLNFPICLMCGTTYDLWQTARLSITMTITIKDTIYSTLIPYTVG